MTPYPLTSRDPRSANVLMREIRRELRRAGCYPCNADEYTVYLGQRAYMEVRMWLPDVENPTVELVKIKPDKKLKPYRIDVRATQSIGVGCDRHDSHQV